MISAEAAAQAQGTQHSQSQPSPSRPLGSDVIRKVEKVLKRFVHFKDPDTALLIAVWILGTYAFRAFDYCGYLWITSATMRSGKTLLLTLLQYLCANATQRLSNITEAVLFHMAGKGQTLVLDEIESLQATNVQSHGAIMDTLCNGFQRGGTVPRMEKVKATTGETFVTKLHDVYCPKAFAGINNVKETIEDRSFKIVMQRKPAGQVTERFRPRNLETKFKTLREQMKEWAEEQKGSLENVDTNLLDKLEPLREADDRFKDIAEPLYVLAWRADEEWIESRVAQEKLLLTVGCPSLAEEEQRMLAIAKAREAGLLVLPRLAAVLKRTAAERNQCEAPEPIAVMIPWMEERLKAARHSRVFVPTEDLIKVPGTDGHPVWDRGSKSLGTYLGKLGLKPGKDTTGTKRGYWIDRKWLEDRAAAYVGAAPIPGYPSNASEASEAQQNQPVIASEPDFLSG